MNEETINFINNIDFESNAVVYEKIVSLFEENRELKKQLEEKNNGFVASTEELVEYAEENEKLKEQLEEINNFINKASFVNIEQLMLGYCAKVEQQKEFIEYLENEINEINEQIKHYDIWHEVGTDINFLILKKQFNIEILSKYKEIIGVKDE